MADIQNIRECPDCASDNIVHNLRREQVICRDCGLIYEPMSPVLEEKFERTHGMMGKLKQAVSRMKKAVKKKPAKVTKKPAKKKAKKKAKVKKAKKKAKKTKKKRR